MRLLLLLCLLSLSAHGYAFAHSHANWNALLAKHVRWAPEGGASAVDYAAIKREQKALSAYLDELEAVSQADFTRFSKAQQQAFLINAYNAQTVALILQKYPDVKSIKDLGSWLKSPWKMSFFKLLGGAQTLDALEHEMLRAPGRYDDPRVHFAVNCASIGCPALRNEAYVAKKLDAQLEDQLRRFVLDKTRNRYSVECDCLQVSAIFDWYGGDFAKGQHGFGKLTDVFAKFADGITADPKVRTRLAAGQVEISFLDYDWQLNDRLK